MELMKSKKRKPIFVKFEHVSGHLISFNTTFQEITHGYNNKFRYLILDDYPKAFELFVGKESGDFKPKYEKVDELKPGDNIDVYFDEFMPWNQVDSKINNLVQFVDKDGQPYFIRGDADKTMGAIGLVLGILIGGLLIFLKNSGKII